MPADNLPNKILTYLKGNIDSNPTQQEMARYLNISDRSLRRQLKVEGTNYKAILEGVKSETAIDYLRNTELSIDEIAALLGYSETSNFALAFKRWTNSAPGANREQYLLCLD